MVTVKGKKRRQKSERAANRSSFGFGFGIGSACEIHGGQIHHILTKILSSLSFSISYLSLSLHNLIWIPYLPNQNSSAFL